ncbi:putative Sensor histidine kinase [Candidatus Filomicrobium marinum]|uniref:histidine kinase n=2 Tax=Filomicrobium TaxID=119044 RepID=A0A0D6JH66_9HYPH|nr:MULTISPECIES: CHASE domain-containing protein [Filomicrobium]MCV0369828.1 CHASE domain-containing protein [Filomicrobium sp.]CFX51412.1 putative Sensor histidine kinase [Candidatus Filomicrobium marinum]CPR20132.1 putative Sensor histidine kinase [Candidatus Filomicrobium marinum]SDP10743.1 Two-component sensor histidine kinase, contains HisKA and HATPase domains [Filomicrobium insigne]
MRPTVRSVMIVAVVGLTATTLAWRFGVSSVTEQAEKVFQGRTEALMAEIERSTTAYEHMLRGTQALFETLPAVSRTQFRRYVEALRITENFPGIKGIGFAAVLTRTERDAHIAAVRGEGFPSYDLKPKEDRDIYSAVVFVEPFVQNREVLGFDMWSEPVRRAAMIRARDTGLPAASGYVTSLQTKEANSDSSSGFLLYLPLYRENMPTGTVEERRAALRGFIYSPLRVKELMKSVVERQYPRPDRFTSIAIFDATGGADPKQLYQSENLTDGMSAARSKPRFSVEAARDLYGANWLLRFESTPEFEQSIDYSGAHTLLAAGLMATALLSFLVLSIGQRQAMADEANERMSLMTRELAHRVKNTLAVVQSIATRSLSDGRNVEEAREVFSKRLHALARAHTLLLDSSWSGAPLRELVQAELEAFGARAIVSGPDVQLSAGTAQTLALILHELATNAVKYGAMSNSTGRVSVRWNVVGRGRNAVCRFEWQESGGPPVNEPTRRGFGQTLLRQSLAHGPDSQPKITFAAEGLRYEFSAPLAAISADESDELTLPD